MIVEVRRRARLGNLQKRLQQIMPSNEKALRFKAAFSLQISAFAIALLTLILASQANAQGVARRIDIDAGKATETIFSATNAYRVENRIKELEWNNALWRAAQGYAEFLAENQATGHNADNRTPQQRAEAQGYRCPVTENVFTPGLGYTPENEEAAALDGFQSWKSDQVSNDNMLSPANVYAGAGAAAWSFNGQTYYVIVEMFGTPCGGGAAFVEPQADVGVDTVPIPVGGCPEWDLDCRACPAWNPYCHACPPWDRDCRKCPSWDPFCHKCPPWDPNCRRCPPWNRECHGCPPWNPQCHGCPRSNPNCHKRCPNGGVWPYCRPFHVCRNGGVWPNCTVTRPCPNGGFGPNCHGGRRLCPNGGVWPGCRVRTPPRACANGGRWPRCGRAPVIRRSPIVRRPRFVQPRTTGLRGFNARRVQSRRVTTFRQVQRQRASGRRRR